MATTAKYWNQVRKLAVTGKCKTVWKRLRRKSLSRMTPAAGDAWLRAYDAIRRHCPKG